MTFVDYCFEGLIPFYCCLLVTAWFQLSTVALAATIMLNSVFASLGHSGWNIPGVPDFSDHWLHHTKVKFLVISLSLKVYYNICLIFKVAPKGQGVNYGTSFNLMDQIMDTSEPFDQVIQTSKNQQSIYINH